MGVGVGAGLLASLSSSALANSSHGLSLLLLSDAPSFLKIKRASYSHV